MKKLTFILDVAYALDALKLHIDNNVVKKDPCSHGSTKTTVLFMPDQ